ncbi:MAG: tRNA preQ1(34) S-adenosylmethionine ribosyltransferase-isomerase QueA [Deltaproteobacteria bacterium]|nr:tRNA preQ1(34) S-adenosylmethionine ribosyltransferase-isomerase QueA [Deltaproteobacteria bacterium]
MRVDLLHYPLPVALIAKYPARERDGARLMVVGEPIEHRTMRDLPDVVPAGALVVVNDTMVIPARLRGHKVGTGGKAQVLLVERKGTLQVEIAGRATLAERWSAMGRPARRLRPGAEIAVGEDLVVRVDGSGGADGLLGVLLYGRSGAPPGELIEREGLVPLPPYLGREPEPADRERYQTVYACRPGAVAAPTAGLHLTEQLLAALRARGCALASVTLHVGPGTFRPVAAADLDQHPMHAERFEIADETARAVAAARAAGRPVVAVGTTVVRALESAADTERPGLVRVQTGATRLLIQPGYRFKVVDELVTNFHLPGSTLLALVAAFTGLGRVLGAYRLAVLERYRFYSYGDAMYLRRSLGAGAP